MYLHTFSFNVCADTEVEKLKKAVESLMAANEEKERHIEELRRTMRKYKRVEEMIATSHGRKGIRYAKSQYVIIAGSTLVNSKGKKLLLLFSAFLNSNFLSCFSILENMYVYYVSFLFRLIDS